MSNENKKIRFLKALRESLIGRNSNEEKNEIIQFYEDSLKLNNVADGMVIIITENNILYEKVPKNISHQRAVQELCDTLPGEHIDLSKVEGDFGHAIPLEYNSIFIRMASILNGPTIVYYPELCNEFQIKKIEDFNNSVKQFNASNKGMYKVNFEYNGKNDDDKTDLDELVEELKGNLNKSNTIVK